MGTSISRFALRILDVNLNRARESLRVIEDYARFVLENPSAAHEAKQLRHDLRAIASLLGAADLLAARDIDADESRFNRTASEMSRGGFDSVAGAAFGRLSEAARSIAEFSKLYSQEASALAEQLRYAAYRLEQQLLLRGHLPSVWKGIHLYVIVTEALCRRPWLETAEAVLRGGARAIQLREKSLPDAELLRRTRQLHSLASSYAAMVVVNDRADIAHLGRADGLHLGQDDLSVADARRIVGPHTFIGKSTHTVAQVDEAIAEKPDYIAVGPIDPSATKPQAHIAGLPTLSLARQRTELPIVAIGGINRVRAMDCFRAGADCVCVCSAVIGADDPESAAREMCNVFPGRGDSSDES